MSFTFCKTNFETAQGFYRFVFLFWHIHENTPLCETQCDTRENFAGSLNKFFHLKTSKASFYLIQWISIHSKVVWNLDRGISPPRKICWETGDMSEWGSQTEIKFHDGSHVRTLIRRLNKVIQARNYFDYNWEVLGYPLLTELFSWVRFVIEDNRFKYVASFKTASVRLQLKVLGSTGKHVFVIRLIVVMLMTGN